MSQSVYLDRDQCEWFNVSYFDDGKLVIAADRLLWSKGGDGYDAAMTKVLMDHKQDTLILERAGDESAGWYTVSEVIPSMTRPESVRAAYKLSKGNK